MGTTTQVFRVWASPGGARPIRAMVLFAAAAFGTPGCIASPDSEPVVNDAAPTPDIDARSAPRHDSGEARPDATRPPSDVTPPDPARPDATRPPLDVTPPDPARPDATRPTLDDGALPDATHPPPDLAHCDADACGPLPEPPCDDAEAGEPIDLGLSPGISRQGELLRAQDLEVPIALNLCVGDEDWFQFTAHAGEHITVWATSDALPGFVALELSDAVGRAVGQSGAITVEGAPTSPARFDGANEGRSFIAVRRPALGEVLPYTLFVRIDPALDCEGDFWEVGPGAVRNDTAADATVLAPRVPALPGGPRFEYDAEICNIAENDRDWYRFPRPPLGTRTCITAEFNPGAGDLLGTRIFLGPANPGGPAACQADLDCDVNGDGLAPEEGFCLGGVCRTAEAHSAPGASPAMVDFARGEAEGPGDTYVLVEGVDGGENGYRLTVSLNPREMVCQPDVYDNVGGAQNATFLGAGQAGVCDAWLCNDQRGTGDWYSFDLLPGTLDRTVVVTYRENSDGRVMFLVTVGDANDVAFYERPFDLPPDPRGECLNIRASALGGEIEIGVMGEQEDPADGDSQIDYTLRILPTDLAIDPDGRCDEFIGEGANAWEIDQP